MGGALSMGVELHFCGWSFAYVGGALSMWVNKM